jgi:nucleotide-binding universal stress UspA family protein
MRRAATRSTFAVMCACSDTVVVGYDGSDTSRAAIALAARRARGRGRVVVVHSFEDPRSVGPSGPGGVELEAALGELLAGVAYEALLSAGAPARALIEVARDRNAMEIVVGARRVGLVRSGLGSVAGAVLHDSHRPVTIVPPGFDPDYPETA